MAAIFYQTGHVIDYTPAEAVGFGDVVDLSTRIGVAGADIPAKTVGPVQVTGVYRMPKAADAVTVGQALYWAKSAGNITTTAEGNTPAGWAAAPAESEDAEVLVKLLG